MAISMQGTWKIRVKSAEADAQRRYLITGAASQNGFHPGTPGMEITVTGDHWSIQIQHNPGSGWLNSTQQITFPVKSGAEYHLDIQSMDSGPGEDFDDLILTCSMTSSATDFLVYGSVKTYSGHCLLNPCAPKGPWVVIDDWYVLAELVRWPVFYEPLKELYPELVLPWPPLPNPPDPPFRPLVLPVGTQQALPSRKVQLLTQSESYDNRAAGTVRVLEYATVSETRMNTRLNANPALAELAITKLRPRCTVDPLPDTVVRFQEYDRSPVELAGGAYTGTGPRHALGSALTDRNGNYVFRFTLSIADIASEVVADVAPGEDVIVQAMPDLIAQVMDSSVASGVIYESSPYFNVPLLRRIDICLPKWLIPQAPACVGGQIIQSLGNVNLGPLNVITGQRTTSNTFLGAAGLITSRSSIGPAVNCAAWRGGVYLYACLNNPDIRYYTVRYRKQGTLGWNLVTQEHTQYRLLAVPPWELEESVKVSTTIWLDGVKTDNVVAYKNVETDPLGIWKLRWLQLKMKLQTYLYETAIGGPGSVQFRIEGYRADGTKIAGADDSVVMYIDNYVDYAGSTYLSPTMTMIDPADLSEISQGDCALFTLPDPAAPLRLKFRANQLRGFMDSFSIHMEKGSTGEFAKQATAATRLSAGPNHTVDVPAYIKADFKPGDDLNCQLYTGSDEDVRYDLVNDLLTVELVPSGGAWLTPAETFCAFRLYIQVTVRITDGQYIPGPYWSGSVMIGIKKP